MSKLTRIISILLVIYSTNSIVHAKYEDCEKPPEVKYSTVVVRTDENEEFVTANYRCEQGYRLKGKSEMTCDLDTEEWQGSPPQCIEDSTSTASGESESTGDHRASRRRPKVHEIKEETQITDSFANELDLSCMSKGLVKAPAIENGSVQKYNRRRKGEKIFLVAFYECNEDFELENLEQDKLYCSHERWIGNLPRCMPLDEESGGEDDEEEDEDYTEGNGNTVSGGETEDESENGTRASSRESSTPPPPPPTSTTELSTTSTEHSSSPHNLTLPCDADNGGCDHECQMVKYHFDPEPIIVCSCRTGFLLDENDQRRCHDIDECAVLDHECEQICNNLPGTFECACHPGLRVDPDNVKKCVDVNECLENPTICGENECANSYGTYQCIERVEPTTSTTIRTIEPDVATDEIGTADDHVHAKSKNDDSDDESGSEEEDEENETSTSRNHQSGSSDNRQEEDTYHKGNDEDEDSETHQHHLDFDEPSTTSASDEKEITTTQSTTTIKVASSGQEKSTEDDDDEAETSDEREDEKAENVRVESDEDEKKATKEMHHQSSTVKSDLEEKCDDGLRLAGDGTKCDSVSETEGKAEIHEHESVTSEINVEMPTVSTELNAMKPVCQQQAAGDENDDEESGVVCYCPYGYELTDDESSCQDINECEIYGNGDDEGEDEADRDDDEANRNHHPSATFCSHSCTNLIGSFICSCPENFHIHDDMRTCVRDFCADLLDGKLNKTECSHDCIDGSEGFICRCPTGFTLENDGKTCSGNFVDVPGTRHHTPEHNSKVEDEDEDGGEESDSENENVASTIVVECSNDDHDRCSPGSCLLAHNGDKECSCPPGYASKSTRCVDVDECEYNSHSCSHMCHNTAGSYTCSCPGGLHLSDDGKTCDDFDECQQERICGADLECSNTYGSYKCICPDGKEMDESGRCESVNLCNENNGGCSHSCRTHNDEVICDCPEEMDLDDDMKSCVMLDPCHATANGGCSHYCDSTLEPICYCPPGYVLADDDLTCEVEFKCDEGYKLSPDDQQTCIDVDECEEKLNICLNGRCENSDGSYLCHCHVGYQLSNDSRTCLDVDECETLSPCSHRCRNLPGSYQCLCPYGQILIDGHTCGFADLCDFNNGGCAHECDSIDNKVSCSCRKGYQVDDEDERNCIDVDECAENNGGCHHQCTNSDGSFSCSCRDGFESNKDKISCVDIDECVENNGNCSNICINLIGSHACSCEAGFILDSDNHTCADLNECEDLHDCQQICINTEGTYECACRNGFILAKDKLNCVDVDECLDSPCINGICNNTLGSFSCQCEKGFELSADGFECQDVDECSHEIQRHACSHHCHNTVGGYSCSCPQGMQLNEDSVHCDDINECETDAPCSHECENIERGFVCKCPPGFNLADDLKTCVDIDECDGQHHNCTEICTNTEGSFSCSCSNGKSLSNDGASCEHFNPCSIDSGGCSQICSYQDAAIGVVCSCRGGFEIDLSDKTKCNDIDECAADSTHHNNRANMTMPRCHQQCINTIGSFKCECFPGFVFNENELCIDVDECKLGNRCPKSSQCINTAGSYNCICPTGMKLSKDKNDCIEIKNECKAFIVKNGSARCTRSRHKTQLFYRTKCAISCDKGFKLHGPSIKFCNGSGHWQENGEPICVPSACPRLSKPSQGTILPTNCMYGETFAGERCFLHCPSGYKALGKRVAVCNQKLEWQPQAQLECVPAQPRPTVSRTSTSASVAHKFHHQQQQQQQFRPTIKCPEDMHVLKPKHQETVHVKIPKPETNVDWELHVDSQPAWAKQLETFLSVGSFEVMYRAKSPFSNQFDLCRFIVNVVDPEPPTVKFCPEPFVVQLHAQETSRSITWQEPIFESKHQPIKQVFKSKQPGHSFTTGVYPITYIASTDDGLSAKCTFRITVKAPVNVKHHHHDVPVETSRRIALETNSITDSYETENAAAAMTMHKLQPKMENHESFLICPGRQAVKLSSSMNHGSLLLPRGCVIKNVKVRRTGAGGGPSSSRQHQQQRAQGQSPTQSNNVIVNEENQETPQTSKRKSNRLRFYSSWDREQRQRHHENENQNSLPQPTTPQRSVNQHNHHRQHQQQQHRATSATTNNVHSNYRHYPNSFPVAYWD